MTLQDALSFLTFSFVAAITPGPSNVILTATGATVGLWRGLPCLLGVSLGMGTLMLFVGIGLGKALIQHPQFMHAMNWVGVIFLIWLSWKIASAPGLKSTDKKPTVGFLNAALFQWINPKSWIVCTGAVSAYFRPQTEEAVLYAFTLACLFLIAALPSNLVWLTCGAMLEQLLAKPAAIRFFNGAMGLLLAISAVLMIL
jgi:threonine/homoserine/homoserine lactone efflux protein